MNDVVIINKNNMIPHDGIQNIRSLNQSVLEYRIQIFQHLGRRIFLYKVDRNVLKMGTEIAL